MGFLQEINDAFMEGLKQGPSPSWFGGLKVKRVQSPIAPHVLAQQQERVSVALTAWQEKLHGECFRNDEQSLADRVSDIEAWTYFNELDISSPWDLYLFDPWRDFVKAMLEAEPMFQTLKPVDVAELSSVERLKLHEQLTYLEKVLEEPDACLSAWSDHLFLFAIDTLGQLLEGIRTAPVDVDLTLSCPLVDCLPNPHDELAKILQHFAGCDVVPVLERGLFIECQEKLFNAVLAFSNLKPEDLEKKEPDTPLNHQKTPAGELVPKFMGKTPFAKLLMTPVPYGL